MGNCFLISFLMPFLSNLFTYSSMISAAIERPLLNNAIIVVPQVLSQAREISRKPIIERISETLLRLVRILKQTRTPPVVDLPWNMQVALVRPPGCMLK